MTRTLPGRLGATASGSGGNVTGTPSSPRISVRPAVTKHKIDNRAISSQYARQSHPSAGGIWAAIHAGPSRRRPLSTLLRGCHGLHVRAHPSVTSRWRGDGTARRRHGPLWRGRRLPPLCGELLQQEELSKDIAGMGNGCGLHGKRNPRVNAAAARRRRDRDGWGRDINGRRRRLRLQPRGHAGGRHGLWFDARHRPTIPALTHDDGVRATRHHILGLHDRRGNHAHKSDNRNQPHTLHITHS